MSSSKLPAPLLASTPLPTAVDLHGNVYLRRELLTMKITRWTASKKKLILDAHAKGMLSLAEISELFNISKEEFEIWSKVEDPKSLQVIQGITDRQMLVRDRLEAERKKLKLKRLKEARKADECS